MHRLTWVDRTGRVEPVDLPAAMYFDVAISPDGQRAAVTVIGGTGGDAWVYDFSRKTFTRLTFVGSTRTPVWSPDGKSIYFTTLTVDNSLQIARVPADGGGEQEVVAVVPNTLYLRGIFGESRAALVDYTSTNQLQDLGVLPFGKDAKIQPLITTQFDEFAASLSPDRRWVAYQSNETTRYEVYVREASGKGGRWQVSSLGGEEPRWSADGRELYFRNDTRMMVARINPGASFQNDTPQLLFEGVYNLRSDSGISYDVSGNGRFLMIRPTDDDATPAGVRMILNWTDTLKQAVSASR